MLPISTYNPLSVAARADASAASSMLGSSSFVASLRIRVEYDEKSESVNPFSEDDSIAISSEGRSLFSIDGSVINDDSSELEKAWDEVMEDPEMQQRVKDQALLELGSEIAGKVREESIIERQRDLSDRDKQVREREKKHLRAAGNLSDGSSTYRYEVGPDGKRYAVEGHTDIKVAQGSTPEERLRNAERAVQAASQAGASSPEDRKVIIEAQKEVSKAREEIAEEKEEKNNQAKKSSLRGYDEDESSANYMISYSPSRAEPSGKIMRLA